MHIKKSDMMERKCYRMNISGVCRYNYIYMWSKSHIYNYYIKYI